MSLGISVAAIVDRIESTSRPGLLDRHDSWTRVPLGSVARIINGAAFKSALFNTTDEGLPLVRIRDVGTGKITTYYSGDYEQAHIVETGDLLVGMDGDFRIAPWHGPTALLNQRACRIEADERFVSRGWVRYVLPGYLDAIWEHTSAITVKHLSSRSIAEIPIPLPPLAEQHRIVEALEEQLSRLDAAASYTAHAKANLKALEKSLLHETWKRAESHGGLTPISEVADTTLGKMLDARRNSGVPTRYLANINVRWGSFRMDSLRSVPLESREIDKFSIKAGDVLICEGGEPGRCAVWNSEDQTIAFQKALHRARCRASIRPHWLALCLKAAVVSGKTDHLLTGTTFKHLPQEKLRALKIPIPSLETQDELLVGFQEIMESVLRQGEAIEIHTRRSKHLREIVLTSAFAGTLVDQDPADEPASVLLERIAAERVNAKPAVRRRASAKANV